MQIVCSHWAAETYMGEPEDGEFLKMQLQGTMNWSCPRWLDWFHGGLQFQVGTGNPAAWRCLQLMMISGLQIEHHCFPRLPRHNLRRISYAVQQVCKEYGLEYRAPTFPEVRLDHVDHVDHRPGARRPRRAMIEPLQFNADRVHDPQDNEGCRPQCPEELSGLKL